MNIITNLPLEIKNIIKPYIIGYKDTIIDEHSFKKDIWIGPEDYRTGTFCIWYPTEQLHYKRNYHNGKQHGIQQYWYPTGQLCCNENYYKGNKHGPERTWYPTGKLKYERNWNMGELV